MTTFWRAVLLIALILITLAIPLLPALAQPLDTPIAPGIKDWLLMLFGFDWLNVILVAIAAYALGLLVYWQLKRDDGFDLRMLFADLIDGAWTVRPGKVYQAGAFAVTSWAFVFLITHDKLTEFYLLAYTGLWAASPIANRWAASRFPVAGEQLPPSPAAPLPEGKP